MVFFTRVCGKDFSATITYHEYRKIYIFVFVFSVSFCSKSCQRENWKAHKPSCIHAKSLQSKLKILDNKYKTYRPCITAENVQIHKECSGYCHDYKDIGKGEIWKVDEFERYVLLKHRLAYSIWYMAQISDNYFLYEKHFYQVCS